MEKKKKEKKELYINQSLARGKGIWLDAQTKENEPSS